MDTEPYADSEPPSYHAVGSDMQATNLELSLDKRRYAASQRSAESSIVLRRFRIGRELTVRQRTVLSWIDDVDRCFLKSWFHVLAPPRIESLMGEYHARLLDQGGPRRHRLTARLFGMYGPWVGKAFYPLNETSGVGYNCFQSDDGMVRKLQMRTSIEPSTLDHGASMFIRYRDKNHRLIRRLVGEVREVTPGVLLGVGVFGLSLRYSKLQPLNVLRRKIPFVLFGPCRPFQHDSITSAAEQAA